MSKLDEAFLKAYAKEHGPVAPAKPTELVLELNEQIGKGLRTDSDGRAVVRRDDGAPDAAATAARSALARTRGATTAAGHPAAPARSPADNPYQPTREAASPAAPATEPSPDPSPIVSYDTAHSGAHSFQGPHFETVSVDVAAYEPYTLPQFDRPQDAEQPSRVDEPEKGQQAARAKQAARADRAETERASSGRGEASTRWIEVTDPAAATTAAGSISADDAPSESDTQSTAFQPVWEVDRFEFDQTIERLCESGSPLWEAGRQLRTACREGLKVLLVTSPLREQGRTTLAATLSRIVAATGVNVALLDGDFDRPGMADRLNLDIQMGWSEAIGSGLPAEEVAVHSLEDHLTVLPLLASQRAAADRPDAAAMTRMLDQLRRCFELVVIDTGTVGMLGGAIPGAESPGMIDAALVIEDVRGDDSRAQQACIDRLRKLGIENIGIVENFAD